MVKPDLNVSIVAACAMITYAISTTNDLGYRTDNIEKKHIMREMEPCFPLRSVKLRATVIIHTRKG
jgi:hypothetical protein